MASDLNDWIEIVQVEKEESLEKCSRNETVQESMNENNTNCRSIPKKTVQVIKLKPLQLCVIKIQNLLKVI